MTVRRTRRVIVSLLTLGALRQVRRGSKILALVFGLTSPLAHASEPYAGPILDMHAHAHAATSQGPPPLAMCTPFAELLAGTIGTPWGERFLSLMKSPPCADPVWSPETDLEVMRRSLAQFEKYNVYAVTSGPLALVKKWRVAAPDRVIPGLQFLLGEDNVTPADLRRLFEAGEVAVFGEVTNQYAGIEPDDPRFAPYWDVAEELDIPVGIHIGTGPPGAPYLGFEKYRARMHSPLKLEAVLVERPTLRVYIMHAGWPMLDDTLALLYTHPQVYVEVGVLAYLLPRAEFDRYLRTLVEAGFGERVLFGSDQMIWPETIGRAIDAIQSAAFLTTEQKRAILYGNAARFLKLSPEDIARHHAR